MGLSLVTAAPVEPISLIEAKEHLRIDTTDDDTLIYSLIVAARNHVETMTRRALVQQTWDYTLTDFPIGDIELPIQPVSSVTSVSYTTQAGASATFTYGTSPDTPKYDVITDGPRTRVLPKYNLSWPETRAYGNAVTVRFVAGYSPSSESPQDYTYNIPGDIKAAIKLIVGDLYENRESSTQLRMQQLPTVDALLSPYILRGF